MRLSLINACLIILIAVLGVIWTPYDPTAINIDLRLEAPSSEHLLGTDRFGRDMLSLLMAGAHTTLMVACLAVLLGASIGIPLGLIGSAKKGSLIDDSVMRFNEIAFAFPALLTAILITARFGPGASNAILAIGIFNIPVFARMARASALPIWQAEFVSAAKLLGKGDARIAFEHILPNIAPLLWTQAAIQFSLAILAEAGLAYLGLSVQPPEASWGRLLADGQTLVSLAPHIVYAPGLCIVFVVLSFNLLADGLSKRAL